MKGKSFKETTKDILIKKYGKRYWGLYYHNIERKAQAFYKRGGNEFFGKTRITKEGKIAYEQQIPEQPIDYIALGISLNKQQYNVSYKALEKNPTLVIDLARTSEFAKEFKDDVVVVKDGVKIKILSPFNLNEKYKKGEINREQWLQSLETFRETNEYIYRGYE